VELLNGSHVCLRARVNIHRPDVAAVYPGVPEAEFSGFKIQMSVLGLAPEVEFVLQAVLKDQSRVPIGIIRVRRRWREDINAEDQPLVSVVIPCYNQSHFLGAAIESVMAQTYPHFEVVVVDDGSTDNTAAVVARYPGVHYLRQENQGLAAARNTGLRHSIGDRLVFLDADDRLLPCALEVGLASLRDHPECAFVYGHSRFMTLNGSLFHWQPRPHVEGDYYLALLRGCPIFALGSVMYRRAVFESVTGFNPSLSPAADYELYYRIARRFPIHSHDQIVVEYRKHGTSMTRNGELMLRCNLAALRSQWKHVKRSKQRREAYKTGIRFWKQMWGCYVVEQIRAAVTEAEWKRATQGMLSLLRYSPFCLASMLNDYLLPRRTLHWMRCRAPNCLTSRLQTGYSGVNPNNPTQILHELLMAAQERYGKWVHEVQFNVQEKENGPIEVVFNDSFTEATVHIQAGVDANQRRFQLAQEGFHLLSPVPRSEVTFFEEGLSQMFACITVGLRPSDDLNYRKAQALCEKLENQCGDNIVLRLREKEPYISRITAAQIIELCPGFSREDAESLCRRWPYNNLAQVPQSLKEILFVDEHEPQIWQMSSAERATLFFLLSQINPQRSIEIGSANGGSLAVLSRFSQIVYSLDIDPTCKTRLGPRFSNVEFIAGDSRATLPPLLHSLQLGNSALEFVLIDGLHTAEATKRDIENVLQFKPSQPVYILVHDSFNPVVRAGIESADWQGCPYVHSVELDLVPGILQDDREMWGGFAFALLRPVVRQGELKLGANQALLQQAAMKQSLPSSNQAAAATKEIRFMAL
jgi:glycosyltransferase involved in cell wall biosynthesis